MFFAGYSISGIRRVWLEAPFRQISLTMPGCVLLLALSEVRLFEYAAFSTLLFCFIAAEALNTAIECIVDFLAPNWEEFVRDAKDLGSLATMCMLFARGVFLVAGLLRAILWI